MRRDTILSGGSHRKGFFVLPLVAAALAAAGCKSDLNQQLLERELRYQEDQIYHLQDELAEKQARLTSVAGENDSLRRQLGVGSRDQAAPGRAGQPRTPRVSPAAPIPPAIELPDASPLPAPRGGPPASLAPPTLEGVPSLPAEPFVPPAGGGLSLPPAAAVIDPAARPIAAAGSPRPAALVPVAFEEPLGGEPVRLVIKPLAGGAAGGLSVALEPRDQAERLVGAIGGELTVTAFDAALPPGAAPIARWTIAPADAAARFRPTGRDRGIPLALPWPGPPPAGDHVRLHVQAAGAAGPVEAEALVPVR
jgi:hypothetical protein